MMPVHTRTKLNELDNLHGVVISRCYNIMKLWRFTQLEIATVLDISTSSLRRYLANPDKVRLSRDRHDRAFYILYKCCGYLVNLLA
ncbi:antitoxin Xre-like helix-turn-helix domain-containing protein [Pseudoalteromonas sp. J010]|uniref:antitoxin Xre-like helix-turn-helix domain-containing protein n=1 Tax=Pseudoalteromonas sp. J010 TaxID=998465 RepID=UPI000F64F3BB|nr:antitoxin Xre-like helix-turn-helix domain-containing protein [Pseudoalteromonas sp. J010]